MGKDSHQYRRSFGQKNAGLSQSNRAIRQRIKSIFFKLWLKTNHIRSNLY
jgi:hypothetical protein